jgi:23S rRNA pseudouridine2605 synthase
VNPEVRYFVLNKPAGVTTTMKDVHAAKTLGPYLPPGPRVFAVGRLDRESEGVLLLTNDGELAHRIQHPSYRVEKEYLVEVEGSLPAEAVRRLKEGLDLDDGFARALRVGPVEHSRGRSAIAIVMIEGRKRVVRRMFSAVGHPVRRLVRVRVGPVTLGGLGPGEVRPLDRDELIALFRLTGLPRARPGRSSSGGRR